MATTNMTKLIAVDAGIQAGAITYWRLSGEVSRGGLCARLDAAGLGRLKPRALSEEQTLRRALAVIQDKRLLVRPLGGSRGRWAIVEETVDGDTLTYREVFRTAIGVNGLPELIPTPGMVSADLRAIVAAEYARLLGILTPADISAWLTRMMDACDGVSLRDTGGVYFIPRGSVDMLETIADCLGDSSHTIFRVPAMHSADAADAVLAAVEDECRARVAEVEAWLIDSTEPGERARKARAADMAAPRTWPKSAPS